MGMFENGQKSPETVHLNMENHVLFLQFLHVSDKQIYHIELMIYPMIKSNYTNYVYIYKIVICIYICIYICIIL